MKAWMTLQLFENWFANCFCVEVVRYCLDLNISFKALLLHDNNLGHPIHLNDLHPNVKSDVYAAKNHQLTLAYGSGSQSHTLDVLSEVAIL